MKLHAVIGANFGDEGKGLMTDHLSRKFDSRIVVRFNGGAQAGHTVETSDGLRHVFKHFGSGTLAGAPTMLSEHFLVNPVEFANEACKLANLTAEFKCQMIVHPDAKVTTPFDIMFNHAIENTRRHRDGEDKVHGSCGMGIGETEQRHTEIGVNATCMGEDEPYRLHMRDLKDVVALRKQLLLIRDEYYKCKIATFIPSKEYTNDVDCVDENFFNDDVIDHFMMICKFMLENVHIADYEVLRSFEHVIFEGAQGLWLDEDLFSIHNPHVTRSRTGLTNIEDIAWKLKVIDIDVYYMTRSYLTRHGNGPLSWEVDGPVYDGIVDATNFDNHFQGALRFAPFNVRMLVQGLIKDRNHTTLNINSTLVVTCVNQMPDNIEYIGYNNKPIKCAKEELFEALQSYDTWSNIMISDSPCAESVRLL